MRASIQFKLTGTLLAVIACLLLSTLFLAQRSFTQGFADYVDEIERRRLSLMAKHIAELHDDTSEPPWPADIETLFEERARSRAWTRPPGDRARDKHGPPPMRMPPGQAGPHPTALLDLQGERIAGDLIAPDAPRLITVPVRVEGRVVARLQSAPSLVGTRSIERALTARQLQSMTWIAIASMVIAILASLLLGRQLLRPIKRLQRDISRLSSGDYELEPSTARADEIGVLMRDVNRLAQTLRETRAHRRQMFANISHELRTPLTILSAEIEAIHDGIRPLDDRALISIEQEVHQLRHLVDDLYDLSISEVGALSYVFEIHDMSTLVAQEIEALSMPELEGITLDVELEPVQTHLDARRMQQLVRNVLSNAIMYTDAPGRIEVCLRQDAQHLVFSVSDSAPGIAEEDCVRIFDPLYRTAESEARRRTGAGLGLAICKKIVEAHHGEIIAEPGPLGGLRITTTLPTE